MQNPQTLEDYIAIGKTVRAMQIQNHPIPAPYQQVIEQFLPTEEQFPTRTIVPIYEYPDSNPRLFLENKRGFRVLFVMVFISREMAASFYEELSRNGPLKWAVARYLIEVIDNIVFVKTRG